LHDPFGRTASQYFVTSETFALDSSGNLYGKYLYILGGARAHERFVAWRKV
jgi:hypothetical protein